MKRVLVTGGAGMIGSNLVKCLVADKVGCVRVADNLWRGRREYLCNENGQPVIDMDADFLEIDLRDADACRRAVDGVDEVYHLADVVAGIKYVFANQAQVFHDNALIDANVFNAAAKAGVQRLIYVGTACSYPQEKQTGVDARPLVEEDILPANPESAYGWSKLAGEIQTQLYAKETEMKTGVVRLHNVYGVPTDYAPATSQVIPALIVKAIRYPLEPFVVWGSGSQGRSFIHVDDVVDGLLSMMESGLRNGPIQLGTDRCTTIRELAETVVRISGKNIQIRYDVSKPEGDKGRRADYSKAKQILGWEPRVGLEDGVRLTYAWIKQHFE